MSTYGIELLADNAEICRTNLLAIFTDFIGEDPDGTWAAAARTVLAINIVQADALTMTIPSGEPLTFAEWGYLGAGKFQRRDFQYQDLTRRAAFGEDTLFGSMDMAEIFAPDTSFPPVTVAEIAERGAQPA